MHKPELIVLSLVWSAHAKIPSMTPGATVNPTPGPPNNAILQARQGNECMLMTILLVVYKMFNNVGSSVPGTLLVMMAAFMICYLINYMMNRRMVKQEVAKYTSLSHSPSQHNTVATSIASPPEGMSRNNSQLLNTALPTLEPAGATGYDTKHSASKKTTTSNSIQKTVTINKTEQNTKFDINLPGAGIGFVAPEGETTNMNGETNVDEAEVVPNEENDTWFMYGAPVFALPGFLLMDFTNDLRLRGKIAEGGGGVIYKGEIVNKEFITRFDTTKAVVKVLKPLPHMAFSELKTIVFQEIAIMQSLSHHPNVITLIGFTEEPLSIVMKLYDRNLFNLVMAYPEYALNASEYETMKQMVKTDTKLKKGLLVKGFEILPEIALHLAYGMAAGMAEMHLLGILHRDLKSANVLLEYRAGSHANKSAWLNNPALSKLAAKISGILGQNSLAGGVGWGFDEQGKPFCPVNPVICDFGLAKMIRKPGEFDLSHVAVKGMKDTTAIGISYRYAAPEAFNRMYQKSGSHSDEGKPVDVFAFAIMVWELLERKVPFHKFSNRDVEAKVKMGERPFISPQYRDPANPFEGNKHFTVILKVIEATWKQDPRERPSFDELKHKLKPFWLGAPEIRDAESARPPKPEGNNASPFYTTNNNQAK